MAETLFEECYVMKLLPAYKWQLFHNKMRELLDDPRAKDDKDFHQLETLVTLSAGLVMNSNDATLNNNFWDALNDFHTLVQKSRSPLCQDPRMDAFLHKFVDFCKVSVNKNVKA